MRYFLYLSYNGARYHGWQIQPNAETVQEVIERALTILVRTPIALAGAGRTDTGVHARCMVAHFDTEQEISLPEAFVERLNRILPRDIAIKEMKPVHSQAHARFDATSRTYKYYITHQRDVFAGHLAWYIPCPLDYERMNSAASVLLRYADFTSFARLHTDSKTNICTLTTACWQREGDRWVFTVTADRFLRNMVRALVGTLVDVGRGKLSIADFCAIVESLDRSKAGTSAPPEALFLVDITYPY